MKINLKLLFIFSYVMKKNKTQKLWNRKTIIELKF